MKFTSLLYPIFYIFFFLVIDCDSKKNFSSSHTKYADTSIETAIKTSEIPKANKIALKKSRIYSEDAILEKKWVDSVFNEMSIEEKIGQLFMVAAYSNKDESDNKAIDKLIEEYKIGGLIFFQGGPVRQARLTNRFQSKSKIPLFIGIDAEWGLSMRLDSTYRYPWNMTLGAIEDNEWIEKVGAQMAEQSKRMGIHFTFSPVLDINTNSKNPIIGNRSFGEDKENVTEKSVAMMIGLQENGVLATGKHFPGHGDTSTDSHHTLPTVNFSKERLEEVELYPYKNLINKGLASVMVAHLNVPSLEKREGYPSSISYAIVTNLLQKELKFKGLIFTDALNMKGASNFKKPGDIDLEAFLAGNDILLFPENVPIAVAKIKEAYNSKIISDERLNFSVRKILQYKYKAGLEQCTAIDETNLYKELNATKYDALNYNLYENALTVIKNHQDIIPFKDLEKDKIAYIKLGDDYNTIFFEMIQKYTSIIEVSDANLETVLNQLNDFNKVIISFHKTDGAWKNHNFSSKEIQWITEIAKRKKVILTVFTKPYSLMSIPSFENIDGVVVAYQNNDFAQITAAELLFGAISSKGKLPVSINEEFKVNMGLKTEKLNRLGFTAPENVGMNPLIMSRIDLIVKKAIDQKMTPGAQVLVAKKGKVIYQKSFGHHTYDKQLAVVNSDIYDVASLTKIMSTLPNTMQLFDAKKITLDTKLEEMLPIFIGTDKAQINFKEFLSHYARFQAWEPFYKQTLDDKNQPMEKYYRKTYSLDFSKQVAENLYIRTDYEDTLMLKIAQSKLLLKKEYKYSDFTFIILKNYIEKVTGKKLDQLSEDNFYKSIGANHTLYNPLQKVDMSVIPPTENDTYFRHQTIQGYVHDMTAAMEGGVGGHAGIFSNTMDMAKMMQLYLQKGSYGGKRYFSSKTFDVFNTCYFCADGNRRGIGFDKPQKAGASGPTCGCASMTSFGHTGFTGTMAWADPEEELIYIFLSNRTFPNSNAPNALSKNNIREDIQQVIYDAIIR